jgi:hypothetical protein
MATTQDNGGASYDAPGGLDDLFDYDVGIEDIMNGDLASQANHTASSNNQSRPEASKDSGAGLGIDEEVTVVKKRKPTVKFDETRWVFYFIFIIFIFGYCIISSSSRTRELIYGRPDCYLKQVYQNCEKQQSPN